MSVVLSMQVHVRALCERLVPGVGCVRHASACVCIVCAVDTRCRLC